MDQDLQIIKTEMLAEANDRYNEMSVDRTDFRKSFATGYLLTFIGVIIVTTLLFFFPGRKGCWYPIPLIMIITLPLSYTVFYGFKFQNADKLRNFWGQIKFELPSVTRETQLAIYRKHAFRKYTDQLTSKGPDEILSAIKSALAHDNTDVFPPQASAG